MKYKLVVDAVMNDEFDKRYGENIYENLLSIADAMIIYTERFMKNPDCWSADCEVLDENFNTVFTTSFSKL